MRSHVSSPDKLLLVPGPLRILAQLILPSALAGPVLRNAPLPTRQGHSLRTDLTAGIEAVFLLGSPLGHRSVTAWIPWWSGKQSKCIVERVNEARPGSAPSCSTQTT